VAKKKRKRRSKVPQQRTNTDEEMRPAVEPRAPWSRRTSSAAIGVVVVAVLVMVLVFATRSPTSPKGSTGSGSTGTPVAAIVKVTSVSPSTLAAIGIPSGLPQIPALPADTPVVESGGKPVVTYIGAEYCPFCAAERWPVVVALSRFGTFSDLGTTTSASNDVYPNTPTPSFHGSSYVSDYLVFSAAETETAQGQPLDTLTAQQQQLFSTYDTKQYTGGNGGIPFTMIGNLYAWAGSSYDPGILKGLSFDEIASQLDDPSTEVARIIDGSANRITAMICLLTGNQPGQVCSAPYIQQEQGKLKG